MVGGAGCVAQGRCAEVGAGEVEPAVWGRAL